MRQRVEKHVLGQIVGILAPGEHTLRKAEHHPPVTGEKRLLRPALPGTRRHDERRIARSRAGARHGQYVGRHGS